MVIEQLRDVYGSTRRLSGIIGIIIVLSASDAICVCLHIAYGHTRRAGLLYCTRTYWPRVRRVYHDVLSKR